MGPCVIGTVGAVGFADGATVVGFLVGEKVLRTDYLVNKVVMLNYMGALVGVEVLHTRSKCTTSKMRTPIARTN